MSDFQFDEKKHVYTLDGKRLYGVTSVLSVINKPALIQWSANMACDFIAGQVESMHFNVSSGVGSVAFKMGFEQMIKEARSAHRKKKDAAAEKGTDVHALCEEYVKECIEKNDGDAISCVHKDPMVNKFIGWAVENKVQFHASEKRMYSEKLWVAGTCDFTATINGKKYVGDIKTSSGIYGREYFLQCAGYHLMLDEMGEPHERSIIVRLGKDGSFETKESHDADGDKKGFLAALELFKVLENW